MRSKQRKISLSVVFSALLALGVGCDRKAEQHLRPLSLGGGEDPNWKLEGCKEGFVDGTYIGPVEGTICKWSYPEASWTRFRYESLKEDRRFGVSEVLRSGSTNGVMAEGSIEGSGTRFYRIMRYFRPGDREGVWRRETDHFELEVIEGGRVLCVYRMSAEPATSQGRLWLVPEDAQLLRGVACPEVETHRRSFEN